jgi:GT2 family glycosyltransferase
VDCIEVVALVLHYNSPVDVQAVLEDLGAQSLRPRRVVVIDNHSSDEARAYLVRLLHEFPECEIIWRPTNGGYAAAMNEGMTATLQKSVEAWLLLTQDARLSPDAVFELGRLLREKSNAAVVGPLIGLASNPNRVFSAGGYLGPAGRTGHVSRPSDLRSWEYTPPRIVDWVDGSVMLVRRESFVRDGPFFEGYFLYFEEVDLQLRFRRRGWEIWMNPSAVCWQQPGNLTPYLGFRNRVIFLNRLFGDANWNLVLWDALKMALAWARGRRPGATYWIARGLLDGARGRTGMPPDRSMRANWSPWGGRVGAAPRPEFEE